MSARDRWLTYAAEALGLGTFMVAAMLWTAAVEHPGSPIRGSIASAPARRALVGLAMGVTAAALIYSPIGRRSGGHFNPAVTLTFLWLGKVARRDAVLYVLAQFSGAVAGVLAGAALLAPAAGHPAVNYVATVPGPGGAPLAFIGELAISFGMMTLVLLASNTARVMRYTGILAGCLIAIYITIEAPLSGMSMNPARSLAPTLPAGAARALWIYFIAPPVGMLLAAELYRRRYGRGAVRCAKLHHPAHGPCIFGCRG